MLKIRLQRHGKKKAPIFRIVAIESSKKLQGRPVEVLGFYNPKTKDLYYNTERVKHWKSVGAVFSETAESLLKREPTHDLVNGPVKFVAKTIADKKKDAEARPSRPSKKKREKDAEKAKQAEEEKAAAAEAAKAEAEAPKEEAAAEEAPAAEAKTEEAPAEEAKA